MTLRFLAYFISALPAGLGFLWIFTNKKRQCLHDILCKTVVIHDAPLDPKWKARRLKQQTVLAIVLIIILLVFRRIQGQ